MEVDIGLKECEQNGKHAKLYNVSVRGDIDGLFALQLAVRGQPAVNSSGVPLCCAQADLGKNGIVERLVTIKIDSGVIASVQEPKHHQEHATREQQSPSNTRIGRQLVLNGSALPREKVLHKAIEIASQGNDYKQAAEIGEDAGPSDGFKWTVSQPNIVNQKYATGQQSSTAQKEPCQLPFCVGRECHPRRQERKH